MSSFGQMSQSLKALQARLEKIVLDTGATDAAHDLDHCRRVYAHALKIAEVEGGSIQVLLGAAYLHDIANLPKNHPESHKSSSLSAQRALEILRQIDLSLSAQEAHALEEAIRCHSYSRGETPQTLEGRVFQDADRLDALGAIGIARTFAVTGSIGRSLYCSGDPTWKSGRPLDDREFGLDHFFKKLLKLEGTMQTGEGKRLAQERTQRLKEFLSWIEDEVP